MAETPHFCYHPYTILDPLQTRKNHQVHRVSKVGNAIMAHGEDSTTLIYDPPAWRELPVNLDETFIRNEEKWDIVRVRRDVVPLAVTRREGTTPPAGQKEESFLQAILADPTDLGIRMSFADWLEERRDPRSELLRLLHTLTQQIEPPNRPALENRLRFLLEEGVRPVGPFWTNSLGMQFACIPPGTFQMGSPPTEENRRQDEAQHRVTLTRGFFMSVCPVTQGQWQAVMGLHPGFLGKNCDDLPVMCVSWSACQEFCQRLGGRDGKPYRLPTESEWEYSCRGGTTTPFYFGEAISTDQANYNGNFTYSQTYRQGKEKYRFCTTPLGSSPPNAWGLCDMHGNVGEWCADWYGPYPQEDSKDPVGVGVGDRRVVRGGGWDANPKSCRSAFRYRQPPSHRCVAGFRLCFRPD